jgi:competence protein ComEC
MLRVGPNARLIILVFVLLIYVILVNFRPPVLRAALMAVLVMWGSQMERSVNIYNIILAAAAIILLVNPRELLNPGFQFSFCAVLFIISGHQRLSRLFAVSDRLKHSWLYKWVWVPLLVSVSATVGTLPLTWFYYGMIPVYAVVANLIVIPLTGALVLILIFILCVAPVSAYVASGLGGLFSIIYHCLQLVIHHFSKLPYASLDLSNPPGLIVFFLLVLLMAFLYLDSKKYRLVSLGLILMIITGFNLIPVYNQALRISFLDIGQGDAAVLRFPNGNVMLVDAGDKNRYVDSGQKIVIPFLKSQTIMHLQYLVLSHPHHDHIGGMFSLLQTIKIDTVITTTYQYQSDSYNRFLSLCREKQIPIKYVNRGSQLYPDRNCRVYVLHPDTSFTSVSTQDGSTCNNSSIVLRVQYGKNRILFTGDTELDAERYVSSYQKFLRSELLKIAHHGSSTSTNRKFLNQTQPLVAVISVAKNNKFKHPSPIIMDRLGQSVPRIYQTSREGALIFDVTPQMIRKIAWRR